MTEKALRPTAVLSNRFIHAVVFSTLVAVLSPSTSAALSLQWRSGQKVGQSGRLTRTNPITTPTTTQQWMLPSWKNSPRLSLPLPPLTEFPLSSTGPAAWIRQLRKNPFLPIHATVERPEDPLSANLSSGDDDDDEGTEWYVNRSKGAIDSAQESTANAITDASTSTTIDSTNEDNNNNNENDIANHNISAEEPSTLNILTEKLAADFLSPLLDPTIEKNVPPQIIRGAAIDGGILAILFTALLYGISPLLLPITFPVLPCRNIWHPRGVRCHHGRERRGGGARHREIHVGRDRLDVRKI